MENTIKHAFGSRKENNQVRVVVKAKQHKLHVDVYDNGQGIPEERRLLLGKTTVTSKKAPARHWKTCPAEWRTFMDQKVVFN